MGTIKRSNRNVVKYSYVDVLPCRYWFEVESYGMFLFTLLIAVIMRIVSVILVIFAQCTLIEASDFFEYFVWKSHSAQSGSVNDDFK